MEQMADSRQRSSFNAWYGRNADRYNAQRAERYRADPEVRERARQQAAEYRRKVNEEGHEPKLRDGKYTTARVARILDVSTQTLRNWETREMIPKPTSTGKHRLYTENQVSLLLAWVQAENRAAKEVTSKVMFETWGAE